MQSSILTNAAEVDSLRHLLESLSSKSTIVDFEEKIQMAGVRSTCRIWREGNLIIGFAFVDDFNNLWFDMPEAISPIDALMTEMIEWGVLCMQERNSNQGTEHTLDFSCKLEDTDRIRVLSQNGFIQEAVRSMHYSRSLSSPILEAPLPPGYSIRCVHGNSEVEQLVALHRAAFGTNNMTVEERLAIMSSPLYVPDLDLVVVSPNNELAAFCICGFDDPAKTIGYTDPIGTHPLFQKMGLSKALISSGLLSLKNRGAKTARLGTSSTNIAMQKLAETAGFSCVSETLWFSKVV
ncbi:MAG: GNAT family N-acetyltransferase [Anaerolineaceae bacterium]